MSGLAGMPGWAQNVARSGPLHAIEREPAGFTSTPFVPTPHSDSVALAAAAGCSAGFFPFPAFPSPPPRPSTEEEEEEERRSLLIPPQEKEGRLPEPVPVVPLVPAAARVRRRSLGNSTPSCAGQAAKGSQRYGLPPLRILVLGEKRYQLVVPPHVNNASEEHVIHWTTNMELFLKSCAVSNCRGR